MKYTLWVDDNFHYMDPDERYKAGEFDDFESAVAAAERIVDEYLETAYEEGMTAGTLLSSYNMFGEDPFIVGPTSEGFSARSYAERRCKEMSAE